jgi:KRAB domain-containing zinc finger protein
MVNHNCTEPSSPSSPKRHLNKITKPHVLPQKFKQCYFCSTMWVPSNLFKHLAKHIKEKPYKCGNCSLSFVTRAYLVRHVARQLCCNPPVPLNPWRNKCYFCHNNYTEYRRLTAHIQAVHLREGFKRCNICRKYFQRKSVVQHHIRTVHLKEQKYKCELCARRYRRRETLNQHIVSTHTTERPYSCYFCGDSFCFGSHLTLHMTRHTKERSFYCYFCNHPFAEASAYSAHLHYKHTKERPFGCLQCPSRYFALKRDLNRHTRNTHSDSSNTECKRNNVLQM